MAVASMGFLPFQPIPQPLSSASREKAATGRLIRRTPHPSTCRRGECSMAQAIGAAGYGNVGIGFMDGEYMALGDLRIPVFDLGFQLSDMCYDALRVWDGRFFRQDTHMERFDRSIRERRYNTLGYDIDQIGEVLHECVRRSGLRRSMVTVIATRGTPTDGLKDLRTCRNRLMAWAAPYYTVITEDEVKTGCDVVVSNVVRIPPDSVDPTIKNFAR